MGVLSLKRLLFEEKFTTPNDLHSLMRTVVKSRLELLTLGNSCDFQRFLLDEERREQLCT